MTIQGPSDARTQNANNNIEKTHNVLSLKKASAYKINWKKNKLPAMQKSHKATDIFCSLCFEILLVE